MPVDIRAAIAHSSSGLGLRSCRQVRRARPRVQLGQQGVIQRLGLHRGDLALRIVHIAEDDRLGRTRLLAGGDHFAVSDAPVPCSRRRSRPR